MTSTPGNRQIIAGVLLFLALLLYLVLDLECAVAFGCFVPFPPWLGSFDAEFLALLAAVVAAAMTVAGAVRRARARLPAHIV